MKSVTYRLLLAIIAVLVFHAASFATHSLGGEISYQYLGNNNYKVTILKYIDCLHGDANAIREDNPVIISVYDPVSHSRLMVDSIFEASNTLIPLNNITGCFVMQQGAYCVEVLKFEKTFTLPLSVNGYAFVDQRCCLALDINNIVAQNASGLGMMTTVPGSYLLNQAGTTNMYNNSAVFHTQPVVRYCMNTSFDVDNSATDADGDSLAYRFTNIYGGGAPNDAKPIPTYPSTSDLLSFAVPFSATSPLNSAGTFNLDAHTGHIKGRCKKPGTYMAAVACDEYRNHVLINTVTRIYSYEIADCGREVTAAVKTDSLAAAITGNDSLITAICGSSRTVDFVNRSTGAQHYSWDFGDTTTLADTSSLANPSYTYPSVGQYHVKMIAYGTTCDDILQGDVLIADDSIDVDFTVQGGGCLLDTITVQDNSRVRSHMPVSSIQWYSNGQFTYGNPAQVPLLSPGQQLVSLTVITANYGCVASATKAIDVREAAISANNDTTVAVGTSLQLQASGGVSYQWSALPPAVNDLSGAYNAATILADCQHVCTDCVYVVLGADGQGCRGTDTVHVTVSENAYAMVPTAFTPNNDGRNDILKPFLSSVNLTEFRIFNRRGQQVFYSNDANTGWNGDYNGKAAPMDVYLWMIKAYDGKGEKKVFKGNVTLIR